MNILNLRKRLHKTQAEVADALTITRATYANYESGNTQPDVPMLIKIANYFDVSLDYLCGRQYNSNIGYVPDNKKETMLKLLKLDDKYVEKVDGFITALLD